MQVDGCTRRVPPHTREMCALRVHLPPHVVSLMAGAKGLFNGNEWPPTRAAHCPVLDLLMTRQRYRHESAARLNRHEPEVRVEVAERVRRMKAPGGPGTPNLRHPYPRWAMVVAHDIKGQRARRKSAACDVAFTRELRRPWLDHSGRQSSRLTG